MPSKLRIVLKRPDSVVMSGKWAKDMLLKTVNILAIPNLPVGWQHFPMRAKLTHLAKFLPAGYELILIQEQKHTRASRSLYLKLSVGTDERIRPNRPRQRGFFENAVPARGPQ